MKTQNVQTARLGEELDVLSKIDLLMIKTAILLFGTVLNICFFELFF